MLSELKKQHFELNQQALAKAPVLNSVLSDMKSPAIPVHQVSEPVALTETRNVSQEPKTVTPVQWMSSPALEFQKRAYVPVSTTLDAFAGTQLPSTAAVPGSKISGKAMLDYCKSAAQEFQSLSHVKDSHASVLKECPVDPITRLTKTLDLTTKMSKMSAGFEKHLEEKEDRALRLKRELEDRELKLKRDQEDRDKQKQESTK
ncbi:hypothetical protein EDD86DRAFT_213974 [Gorgonomyces haynaldii]|nr:hypothetical protein EDD86DRAFT_213974 [Gorgonomyces haynaldii]